MKHYTVKVTLYGIKPEIWRRFSVPADSTFAQFHTALQYAMGWEHLYDHEFPVSYTHLTLPTKRIV